MNDLRAQLSAALAGRYAIERELGRGGMATVFRARDLKHERPVALKVLDPELASALGPERFLREIRIAAQMQQPNIVPLYDSGEAGGLLFYVMPCIEGGSLRARLEREKQLPLEDVLRIAGEIAAALGHAHQAHVVHRDIKPENVLFDSGRAVVTDFGIARAVHEAGGRDAGDDAGDRGTEFATDGKDAAGRALMRWLVAEAFERSGRPDSAAAYCELALDRGPMTGPDWYQRAMLFSFLHQRLAVLDAELGACRGSRAASGDPRARLHTARCGRAPSPRRGARGGGAGARRTARRARGRIAHAAVGAFCRCRRFSPCMATMPCKPSITVHTTRRLRASTPVVDE
jgi:serine/threonine protein kinase